MNVDQFKMLKFTNRKLNVFNVEYVLNYLFNYFFIKAVVNLMYY